MPMKISDVLRLLEQDGWTINGSTDQRINGSTDQRINGSTDQRIASPLHPYNQTGPRHRRGQAKRDVEAEDRSEHPEAGWTAKGAAMRGYIVVFEGDDESGYSAYSPDLPGVIAAGDTREDTEHLMLRAMAEHLTLLRETGQPVPEPADSAAVTILDPAAA